MPADAKPLFRPDALRPVLAGFPFLVADDARKRLRNWAKLLGSTKANDLKETELLPDFITDVFGHLLGFVGPASGSGKYTLKREATIEVDGKFADAVIGRFSTSGDKEKPVVAIEGKGPRDPLDRPFAGRRLSAVVQALQYAVNLPCDWYIVTNFREIRLLHKGHDQHTIERFEIPVLASDDNALRKFHYLLGSERVLPLTGDCQLDILLEASRTIGQELTFKYYLEYADLRRSMFAQLRQLNPDVPPARLLTATQRIIDRVLFSTFCEHRGLLPAESVARAFQHHDPYNPRPIWDNFRGLFRAIDKGDPQLHIPGYNGGLFAEDKLIDSLIVPDTVCSGFNHLATYEYRLPTLADDTALDGAAKIIDVEILGHIFEQSISDLEEMQQQFTVAPVARAKQTAPSKRKQEGAFYTPSFITRYIVTEALAPILAQRFEALRQEHEGNAPAAARKVLANPAVYDLDDLKAGRRTALERFWDAWQYVLATIRIVDPACGSGAFLIEAFEQMHTAYRDCAARLKELRAAPTPSFFDIDKEILRKNLFGLDLNEAAVEICQLSLWIKTARKDQELENLKNTIRVGNSVIADKSVHPDAFDWKAEFPEVFAAGGFDVVICNPPYIRQEWISDFKPYLQQHYKAFDGTADLYVYFYELALNLLRPGGRLGFIVTNKWMRAGYGEPLRRLFGESAWVESVVDFGHAKQIFPDADVFPSILITRKPDATPEPETARVCAIPREQLRIDDLSRQITSEGYDVPRDRLGAEPWSLEPAGVAKLMERIKAKGIPLKEFVGASPVYGIKTGFNDAYMIDGPTKEKLVKEDPKSASLFRPYLRGQDVDRWQAEWHGVWMLVMKSSNNVDWPWSNAGENAEVVFAETYPSVYRHFCQYRNELQARKNKTRFWWELSGNSGWDSFEKPKLVYGEITWFPAWSFDRQGMYVNNTVYIIPNADLWVLAVANSPVIWWYAWRTTVHGKDEALRFLGSYVAELPIPEPTDPQRTQTETAVRRLIDITAKQQSGRLTMLDWLRVEYDIAKPTQKLQDIAALDANAMMAEVKKIRGKAKPLKAAEVKALKDEHARTVAPLQTLTAEALILERQVSDLVNAAYSLTPDEIALMWQTAPPRMPLEPPASRREKA